MQTKICDRCWLAEAHLVKDRGGAQEVHCRACNNLTSFQALLLAKEAEMGVHGGIQRPLLRKHV